MPKNVLRVLGFALAGAASGFAVLAGRGSALYTRLRFLDSSGISLCVREPPAASVISFALFRVYLASLFFALLLVRRVRLPAPLDQGSWGAWPPAARPPQKGAPYAMRVLLFRSGFRGGVLFQQGFGHPITNYGYRSFVRNRYSHPVPRPNPCAGAPQHTCPLAL